MTTRVGGWGDDPVRISKDVRQKSGVSINATLPVDIEGNGAIVVTSRQSQKYRLHDLLNGVTKKNMHREVDFGPSAGREAW